MAAVGTSGKLVTPEVLRSFYQRERQELATEAVFLSSADYLASVTVPPEALSQFYSNRVNHMSLYHLPDRIQVTYVRFDLTNYSAAANEELVRMTNMDRGIEQAYQQRGADFLAEVEAKTLDEAKVKIRDANRKALEGQTAKRKAAEFATPLFDMDPVQADNLDKLAKQKGLTVGTTAPFDREHPPAGLDVGAEFVERAFLRTPADPFAGPIPGSNSVYIIAFIRKIPSEIPPLAQIRDEVVKDYKFAQAMDLTSKAGLEFYQTLTNGLAQGKPFASICLNAKLKPVPVPPFSISTRSLTNVESRVPLPQFKQAAFSTPVGKPSPFELTADGGFIVYVKQKLPLDEARMNAELPSFAGAVRQNLQSEAFNEWFRKQAERGLRDTPLARSQPPPALGSSPSPKPNKS